MTHVLELAEGLSKEEIKSEILFFTKGPSIEMAEKRNILTHFIEKKGPGITFIYKLYKFLQKNRYDVIHTHTINANFFGRIAGKISRVPVLITTVHSHIIDEIKGNSTPTLGDYLRYRIDMYLARWSTAMVAVSEAISERLINCAIKTSKIRTIENGVDTKKFCPDSQAGLEARKELSIPPDARSVGIIGRLVPLKNHDLFIRTAKEVSKKRSDVYFLIIGDGPLMKKLREYVKQKGLNHRVIFTGWRTDIDRMINALDILVLCSTVEGHNVVLLEAMACATPVIGTDVLGIRSIVRHSENGMLIPSGSEIELKKAILYLLDDQSVATSMGKIGRKIIIKNYSIERMLDAYSELYREMANTLNSKN